MRIGGARPSGPTSGDMMRVLVVEDDRETASFLQKALKESGHAADLAEDGEAGLSLAEEGIYDVLIVDRMLPKIDGLTIVRKLRENNIQTPVLILSALADVDERLLASLLTYLEVVKVPPFGTVVNKGEHGDALFMVLEGEVRARVMITGQETTLATLGVGECFGEMAVLDQGPRSADVIANQPSVLIKVSAGALKKMFAEAPALAAPFMFALSRVISQRVRVLTKRYEDSIHFSRTAGGAGA